MKMRFSPKRTVKALSLVELLLVIALYSILMASLATISVNSFRFINNNSRRAQALLSLHEIQNSILLNKNDLWLTLVQNTEAGEKHMAFANNIYAIADGEITDNNVTTSFVISRVYRDGSGNIVTSGGTEDPDTRAINLTASWTDSLGIESQLTTIFYVTAWNTKTWKETLQSDFSQGTQNGTLATTTGDGAVELDLSSTLRGDWCSPELTLTTYNLTRQGVPTSISATPNHAIMGTGENASGPPLDHVHISSANPPVITQLGTYTQGDKVNDIFADASFAYMATDTNDSEITIIQITSTPYTQVGYFDGSGSDNASAVYVSGTTGYMVQNNVLRLFNLTSKTGSRPALGSVTLAGAGKDIMVVGNYAYVAIQGSTTKVQIIDITNTSAPSITNSLSYNAGDTTALFISADGNRAYVANASHTTYKEGFVLDISNKTASTNVISSVDTSGMSPKDVSFIDDVFILVGQNGQEYQPFLLDNEANPQKCGGLENNAGINGIETLHDSQETAWAYVLTNDANAELMIILGGESFGGGGNGQGSYYLDSGEYTSPVFDSGSEGTYYYSLNWDETLFANTDLRFQVRTSTLSNMSGATFVGPDGTAATYFTDPSSSTLLPFILQNKRYIQYKAYFTSDRVNSPVNTEVRISYQK